MFLFAYCCFTFLDLDFFLRLQTWIEHSIPLHLGCDLSMRAPKNQRWIKEKEKKSSLLVQMLCNQWALDWSYVVEKHSLWSEVKTRLKKLNIYCILTAAQKLTRASKGRTESKRILWRTHTHTRPAGSHALKRCRSCRFLLPTAVTTYGAAFTSQHGACH